MSGRWVENDEFGRSMRVSSFVVEETRTWIDADMKNVLDKDMNGCSNVLL